MKLNAEYPLATKELNGGLKTQKGGEEAIEKLSRRLHVQEQRLYSGMVTNPKELHALEQEIHHLQAQQSRQEELTLEVLLATESLEEEAKRKAEALQEAEKKWAEGNAAGTIRRDQLEARWQELHMKREQYVASIEGEILRRY